MIKFDKAFILQFNAERDRKRPTADYSILRFFNTIQYRISFFGGKIFFATVAGVRVHTTKSVRCKRKSGFRRIFCKQIVRNQDTGDEKTKLKLDLIPQ